MVIVQFHGRLVRQNRAYVVDSVGLGITCLLSMRFNRGLNKVNREDMWPGNGQGRRIRRWQSADIKKETPGERAHF